MTLIFFTGIGFVTYQDGRYKLLDNYAQLLTTHSKQSLLPLLNLEKHLMVNHNSLDQFRNAIVSGNVKDYFNQNNKEGLANTYGTAMDNGGQLASIHVARAFKILEKGNILDIGGGAGTYAIKLCKYNKAFQVDIFEKMEMQKICLENIREAGMTDRIHFFAKNILTEPVEKKYDGILISNVLHLFSLENNMKLLKKCRESLNDFGVIVLHDFFLNKEHTSPRINLLFSIDWMMIGSHFNLSAQDVEDLCAPLDLEFLEWKKIADIPTSIITLRRNNRTLL